jgi:chromosome segregation ATPase
LGQELWAAQDSVAAANQELASKAIALDELTIREQAAQDKLQALGEEKRFLEQELGSTQKMFAAQDYSSLEVIFRLWCTWWPC